MNTNLKLIILCVTLLLTFIIVGITTLAEPQSKEINSSNYTKSGFVLKDYKGNLAVFYSDSDSPFEILDVKTDSLPERDAEILKKGITTDTLGEIMSIVEDYEWFFL